MSTKQSLIFISRKKPIVVIDGPRNNEKLSLALNTFPGKQYISLKDEAFKKLLYTSPSAFFMAFPDGAIIDEVQELNSAVKQVELHCSKSDFAAGKFILIFHGIYQDQLTQAGKLTILPEEEKNNNPFLMMLKSAGPQLETVLKDASPYIHSSNTDKFKSFLKLCAAMNGKTLSAGSLAVNCQISAPTAASWLEILEKLGIIVFLKPTPSFQGHSTVKKSKIYFYSTSFLCSLLDITNVKQLILSPYINEIACAFAISNLSRYRFNQGLSPNLSFYQERNGFEVNLLAKWKYHWAFDVCCSTDALHTTIKNSAKFSKQNKNSDIRNAVLYLGEITFGKGNQDWISFLDWEKLANGLNYYS